MPFPPWWIRPMPSERLQAVCARLQWGFLTPLRVPLHLLTSLMASSLTWGCPMAKKSSRPMKPFDRVSPGTGITIEQKYPELAAMRLEHLRAQSSVRDADLLLQACALLGELAERHVAAGVVGAPAALEWIKSVSVAAVVPRSKRVAVLAGLRRARALDGAQFLLANRHLRSSEPLVALDD